MTAHWWFTPADSFQEEVCPVYIRVHDSRTEHKIEPCGEAWE